MIFSAAGIFGFGADGGEFAADGIDGERARQVVRSQRLHRFFDRRNGAQRRVAHGWRQMRGCFAFTISPMTAAQAVRCSRSIASTASRCRGATQSSRPPLVCASARRSCCASVAVPNSTISLTASRFCRVPPGTQSCAMSASTSRLIGGTLLDEDFRADAARAAHRGEMPEQAEAGHVHPGADQFSLREFGADGIQARHQRDRFFRERRRGEAALDARGDDAGAERFREHEPIAGPRAGIRDHARRRDEAGHGEAVNRLGIANGVAADERAAGAFRHRRAAAQDRGDDLRRDEIGGHAHDVQGGERSPAHGVNVRERIGRGDLAVGKRVVHDGREEIHRLHEGAIAADAVNARVVRGRRADEQIRIIHLGKLPQDLRQSLLAELGGSTGARRERRELENLLARHRHHLLSGKAEGRRQNEEGKRAALPPFSFSLLT